MGGAVRARAVSSAALLAAASGLAIGATFSPYGGPVLPFVAFAPLAVSLRRQLRDGDRRARFDPAAPFGPGFVAAVLAHGIGLYWMVPALSWRTALAVPVYILVLVLIGIVAGIACAAAVSLHRRLRWPLPVALAACWTGFEWTAAHVPGISYAWLNSGGSLAWYPAAAAGAELLGARFLTFWTVACGAAAGLAGYRAVRTRAGPRPWRSRRVLAIAGVVVLPLVAGELRQRSLDGGEALARVAAVQAGHGVAGEMDAGLSGWIDPVGRIPERASLDLVAFPERFLAAPLRHVGGGVRPRTGAGDAAAPGTAANDSVGNRLTEAGRAVRDFAGAVGIAVLIGAMDGELAGADASDTLWYNAALLHAPQQGLSRSYRKSRLVPGLEGAGRWHVDMLGGANQGYAPGHDPLPLPLGDRSVGVMVCYDSAYGETARALVQGGASWLAVLSNDDWLDPDLPFRATWAYWQHATHGRLRAIENRIGLIQVAATGYTFAVSPGGEGAPFALPPGEQGIAVLTARGRTATTLYTRIGDILGLSCFLVLGWGTVLSRRASRRSG